MSVCTNTLFKSPAGQQAPSPGAPGSAAAALCWEGGRAQQGEAWGLFPPSARVFPKPSQGFQSLPNHSALCKAGSGGSQVFGGLLCAGRSCWVQAQQVLGAGVVLTPHSQGGLGLDKAQGTCRDELISSLALQGPLVTGCFSASNPAPCPSCSGGPGSQDSFGTRPGCE